MVDRPYYLEWLRRWQDKRVIKVITGMRRSGKSTIMQLFQDDLVKSGVDPSRLLAINFESFEDTYPLTPKELYAYVVARLKKGGKTYLFLDEIQMVEEFEKVVDALFVRDDVDVYITGSNAYFLSGDLATLLTGRYVELLVHPFSFKEYCAACENSRLRGPGRGLGLPADAPFDPSPSPLSREALFERYLVFGGLPYTTELADERDIAEYLGGVFNTVIVNDISLRSPRIDVRAFESTAAFLADNVGNISSLSRIAAGLSEDGKKISPTTVGGYIDALCESFLLYKVDRFDVRGKEYLRTLEKYYLGDLGLRFWLLGKTAKDVGRRIENVVYLELRRRYRQVSIGKQGDKEIDFVTSASGSSHYFQVAQTVLDDQTRMRELGAFQGIKDNYPKTLLTLDSVGLGDSDGVGQRNLIDWLLEDMADYK